MSKVRVQCILAVHLTCAVTFFKFCDFFLFTQLQFSIPVIFLSIQLQFLNYLTNAAGFFLPELILHKYSVEG